LTPLCLQESSRLNKVKRLCERLYEQMKKKI